MRLILLAAGALLCLAAPGADGQEGKKARAELTARITVETQKQGFTVKLYLKNPGDKEVEVVYGRGNAGMTVLPRLDVGDYFITPAVYTRPPSRAMRPNKKIVPAGQELLYGTFTVGYPPAEREQVREVRAFISFRELSLSLETPPVKITIPGGKAD
jgi:hypothetical protein